MALVSLQRHEAALILRLEGLDENGMFSQALLQQLGQAIRTGPETGETRCIVLTGKGDVFCRGGNIGSGLQARQAFAAEFRNLLRVMADCPLPLVAAVNGTCTAGGMSLLAATDYAVCVEGARFGYPELAIGAFPMLATVTAPRHLPRKAFFEMAYTSQTLDAASALRLVLVNEIVADGQALEDACTRFARLIAQRNASSIAAGRALYHASVARTQEDWLNAAVQAMTGLPEIDQYR